MEIFLTGARVIKNNELKMANNSTKLIDSTLFDGFNTLHSDKSNERIAGSLKLLEHLKKHTSEDEKVNGMISVF